MSQTRLSSPIFRAFVHGEERSRFAAVPLKDGWVLQVKPHKTTYMSKEAWQRSVIGLLGEGIFINFTTDTREREQPVLTDAQRLYKAARKNGLNTSKLRRRCRPYRSMLALQGNKSKFITDSQIDTLRWLENLHKEDPIRFFGLREPMILWKDGETIRPIGFIDSHPGSPSAYGLVNDKGVVGCTLADIGVPADAEIYAVKREVVVKHEKI